MIDVDAVLSGQAGGRGVRSLLGSSYHRRALRSVLRPSAAVGTCRLKRVKFKPGRKLSAYYELSLGEGEEGVRALAVTWTANGHRGITLGEGAAAMEAEARERGVVEPFSRLSVSVPSVGLTLQVTPFDPVFPQLVRLADPTHVSSLLAASQKVLTATAVPTVTTIRYRPGQRHVLRYDAARSEPTQAVIAKLHRPGGATSSASVAAAVAALLAGRDPGARAAFPSAEVADDGVVLYRFVDGLPLAWHLARREGELAHLLARAGGLLRLLHDEAGSIAASLPERGHDAEVFATRRACEHVDVLLPPVGSAIVELLTRASDTLARLPAELPGFSHGDYKADHLLVSGDGMTLIDFDSCARAEPAHDLGKFLADLRFRLVDHGQPGSSAAQERFLEGYGLAGTSPRLARARVYEAILLVKLSARRLRVDDPAWPTRTSTMVAEADRVLRSVTG